MSTQLLANEERALVTALAFTKTVTIYEIKAGTWVKAFEHNPSSRGWEFEQNILQKFEYLGGCLRGQGGGDVEVSNRSILNKNIRHFQK